eukprot:CAMPEP_0202900656 /NCGR_PEP_ID=MMETSP1392-20130828/11966_1 /ASSEMBLY_ACC=CAM_ASM_000868 /TAXON_ID=225041 /ORGANISM="Chlamydomonas chlamydogama, Strain SAG 11-48b" /LENGTH=75 /DNA_ID=CAMNT_0049587093 /DNA_START=176 /DNA_END=403 /DNA_ORIENTATION=+
MDSAKNAEQAPAELTTFVQGLLQQMQTRFQKLSDNIIAKVDEMGVRLDDLEKSIGEIMEQAGDEKANSSAAEKAA